MYSDEVVEDEISRVSSQLSNMNPNIPENWKQIEFKVDQVTRENLLEVAEKIKTWMEESVSREAAATANSKKVYGCCNYDFCIIWALGIVNDITMTVSWRTHLKGIFPFPIHAFSNLYELY